MLNIRGKMSIHVKKKVPPTNAYLQFKTKLAESNVIRGVMEIVYGLVLLPLLGFS